MTNLRQAKVDKVADHLPKQEVEQGAAGGLAVVAWGSTYGAVRQAVKECLAEGLAVAQIHLRHLNPLPPNLGDLLAAYDKVLAPELNNGQLAGLLRSRLLIDPAQLNKVSGQPLQVAELKAAITEHAPPRLQEAAHG